MGGDESVDHRTSAYSARVCPSICLSIRDTSLNTSIIAYNETFAYLGGRGVKKIPFIYIIKNGT